MTSEGLYDGLMYGRPKTKFRELSIGYLPKITDDILFKMGPKYQGQLIHLDLRGLTTISDSSLQMIIVCFPNLRYFNVDSCCKVWIIWNYLRVETIGLDIIVLKKDITIYFTEYSRLLCCLVQF